MTPTSDQSLSASSGLRPEILASIQALARENGQSRVLLFGSRARGDHRARSDVDLACTGGDIARFAADVDEKCPTLLSFDVVNLDGPVQPALLRAIEQEGVTLYARA
jgi:hypothetical protein